MSDPYAGVRQLIAEVQARPPRTSVITRNASGGVSEISGPDFPVRKLAALLLRALEVIEAADAIDRGMLCIEGYDETLTVAEQAVARFRSLAEQESGE